MCIRDRGQIADKVEGLDAGANDYMEKPFHLQELEADVYKRQICATMQVFM